MLFTKLTQTWLNRATNELVQLAIFFVQFSNALSP